MKKIFTYFLIIFLIILQQHAQTQPGETYMQNIHGIKLFMAGNQLSYPIVQLGAEMQMELHFDDLDAAVKTYNYTYQLCNADWQPVNLSTFDYIQGFTQGRLSQYRPSSVALTKYIHYQALLPEKSCMPIKSGNYLLKIFLNGDTSKLAFTKRVLVVNNILPIAARITQPFNSQNFRTHQKVQLSIDKTRLDVLNPQQQVKVVVLQNYRWDIAKTASQPLFMRGNIYEYNSEQDFVFPAGKEFRWADLRSFRFQSERVDSANLNDKPFNVWLKPDQERNKLTYIYYADLNGFFEISATDVNNPWWQGDYANVHFIFAPVDNQPFHDKDIYIAGEMTSYITDVKYKMIYNPEKGIYENTLLLKQGFYSYIYLTELINDQQAKEDFSQTEGNYWETENIYTVLVYYRSLAGRSDELVGAVTLNTRNLNN